MPIIQVIKDVKQKNSPKRIVDEIKSLLIAKSSNEFFVTVPLNYDLTGKLKAPVEKFFGDIFSKSKYHVDILNYFTSLPNVIPTLEVNYDNYTPGDIKKLKSKVLSANGSYAYRIDVDQLGLVGPEILSLITSSDYLIYDLGDQVIYNSGKLRTEISNLQLHCKSVGFNLCIVKQLYSNLTFSKMPNGKIQSHHPAHNCIDHNYYSHAKKAGFNHIGDWAGIRNSPLNSGGASYPAYLTIELDTYEHHGFKGIEKDSGSFVTTLVPKYKVSNHWNTILTTAYKSSCDSCNHLNELITGIEKANDASKWKRATVGHFMKSMDYKITNGLF